MKPIYRWRQIGGKGGLWGWDFTGRYRYETYRPLRRGEERKL